MALRALQQMALTLVAKRLARSEPAFETVPLIAEKIENYHTSIWMVPEPESNYGLQPLRLLDKQKQK